VVARRPKLELTKLYPAYIVSLSRSHTVTVREQNKLFKILKLSLLHQQVLTDLFGVRSGVNYHLRSLIYEKSYLVRTKPPYTSAVGLWPSANWLERECWEMFGYYFNYHPDLRRLLTDYGFRGQPLQKNFPLVGYTQVYYSERSKRVSNQPVKLAQEFRLFNFQSPWQN